MDAELYAQVTALFHRSIELPELERPPFLNAACRNAPELKDAVLDMLRKDSAGAAVFDRLLPDMASRLLDDPSEIGPPKEIGPYRRKMLLGQGGMGVVWLAERTDAGNEVAVKYLLHAGLSPARQERFTREIKTLAKLEHPFIARFYDAGKLADGTPWFVMEYVKGECINEYCSNRRLPLQDRLRLFRSVCEAVQHAHAQAVIHRDLKPSNIMVAQDGTPRLLDFGIAKELDLSREIEERTTPGLRFMSWDYAAPEWIRDGMQGLYTDVYSLGVILYELLSGQLPFDRSKFSPTGFVKQVAENDPQKPSLVSSRLTNDKVESSRPSKIDKAAWSDLDVLCLTAMHRDVNQRYKTVEALIRDLEHYLKGEPLESRPDALSYKVAKFVRRNRSAVFTTAAAFALAVGLVTFFTVRLAKARNAAVAEAARTHRIQHFMLNLVGGSDKKAAPSKDLRVITLLDHGVQEAGSLGSDPETQGELYENLGNMYDMLGEFPKAEALLMQALESQKRALNPRDPKLAETMVQIGIVKAEQSRYNEAQQWVQRGLDLAASRLPDNDPRVVSAKSALGRVVDQAGDYQRAIAILSPLVQRKPWGVEDEYVLSGSLSALADAEYSVANIDLAESFVQRSLDLDRRLFGSTHPQVAIDLLNAGLNKSALSLDSEAEADYRQAARIMEAWYGPEHPGLALIRGKLAMILVDEGKLDEAEGILHDALPIQERAYGPLNGDTAADLYALGEIEMKRGNLAAAESNLSRAAGTARTLYGAGNYETAIIGADLGEVYLRQGQYSRADNILGESVKTLLQTIPPGALSTGLAEASWGRTLLALKRYSEAEKQLSVAYRIFKEDPQAPQSEFHKIRLALASTYTALNQPENAKKIRAELAGPSPSDTAVESVN